MLRDFTPRLYQEKIFSTCTLANTLVVIPTGLGKTNIFLMVAAQRLRQYPGSKVLFIGPTRPLISQYRDVFLKHTDIQEDKIAVMTGNISPKKRAELWASSTVIFSTPQGLENDIIAGRISLKEVSLLGVDEAHRAVKEYAYVWIAKSYMQQATYPRIIGLTASPGSDKEKILEVCKNLYIEEIEVRGQEDADVKPYVQEVDVKYIEVTLPKDLIEVQKDLETSMKTKLTQLKEFGFVKSTDLRGLSKKDILGLQSQLVAELNQGNKSFETLKSLSLVAEVMKLYHGLELLESQGVNALQRYLSRLTAEAASSKVKAVQNLARDEHFKAARVRTDSLMDRGVEHPKLAKLRSIVRDIVNDKEKIIIFTQFRDTAQMLAESLNHMDGILPRVFVGQQRKGDTGMSQKEQIAMLEEFRQGGFNVIIMTSVGEEGLDIPKVDSVIFYEPVPSVIRYIQRRGRTGRQEKGDVIVLMTKGTRDEAYRWSTRHKERRMYSILADLKHSFKLTEKPEHPVPQKKGEHEACIYVDHREKGSQVIKELITMGASIQLEQLETADYVLSPRVGVEFKTMDDFLQSIIDGRLLPQVRDMKGNFERTLVVVEGTQDIYTSRNIHPNAVKGVLAAMTVNFGQPVLFTRTPKETAELLMTIAKREKEQYGKTYSLHGDKKPFVLSERQEFLISSLPHVGPQLARDLLEHFKSIKSIIDASEEELQQVPKVGPKIAKEIRHVCDSLYVRD